MVNDFGNCHNSGSQRRIILTLGCRVSTRIRMGFTVAMLFTIVFKNGTCEGKIFWPNRTDLGRLKLFKNDHLLKKLLCYIGGQERHQECVPSGWSGSEIQDYSYRPMVYERPNESLSRFDLLVPLMYLIQDHLDRVVLKSKDRNKWLSRVDSLVPLMHHNSGSLMQIMLNQRPWQIIV